MADSHEFADKRIRKKKKDKWNETSGAQCYDATYRYHPGGADAYHGYGNSSAHGPYDAYSHPAMMHMWGATAADGSYGYPGDSTKYLYGEYPGMASGPADGSGFHAYAGYGSHSTANSSSGFHGVRQAGFGPDRGIAKKHHLSTDPKYQSMTFEQQPCQEGKAKQPGLQASSMLSPPAKVDKRVEDPTLVPLPDLTEMLTDEDIEKLTNQRFVMIRHLQESRCNNGSVNLMWDTVEKRFIVAKSMPNDWVRSNHKEFLAFHPDHTEQPWMDLGCTKFLNSRGCSFSNTLFGVYRDCTETVVTSMFATEGDLMQWCSELKMPPGPAREEHIKPLAIQLLRGIQSLHDLSIVHRDISLENCLVTKDGEKGEKSTDLRLKIIDFGMASDGRFFVNEVRGKRSYQAPEMHNPGQYDGYLSDAFSVGVCIFCLMVMDYPWQGTKNGSCKCFDFTRKYGFRLFMENRNLRCSKKSKIADVLSDGAKIFLEGLLDLDPEKRLTLGERSWESSRRSVWDEDWLQSEKDKTPQ